MNHYDSIEILATVLALILVGCIVDHKTGNQLSKSNNTNRRGFLKKSALTAGALTGLPSVSLPARGKGHLGWYSHADITFPVLSDIHIKPDGNDVQNREEFREIFDQLNRLVPDRDAIMINGDLTDNGYAGEYERFRQIFDSGTGKHSTPLFGIGNHEYYNDLTVKGSHDRFLKYTGMDSIYYHKVINGFHFIVMGTEDQHTPGTFTAEQINWVDEQLAIANDDDPKKPIFVFHHQPIRDTVYGSEWGFENNRDLLYDTLKQYPQVISFSGHSHYPLDDPRVIHQEDFTAVTSATAYNMWVESGRLQGEVPPNAERLNQGLIVTVRGNHVTIHRRDFHNNAWTAEPFVVGPFRSDRGHHRGHRKPHHRYRPHHKGYAKGRGWDRVKFQYTDDRDHVQPQFDPGVELSVVEDETTTTHLTLAVPQASDNLLVHDYRVTVTERDGGETAAEYLAFSEFYTDPVPDPLTLPVDGLTSNTAYDLEVRALDAFGNESEQVLTATAETKPQVGDLPGDTVIEKEDFDELESALRPAQDESIDESTLGWTHDAPKGWRVELASEMPQGTSEWQGWSFTTMDFWTAADGQGRSEFTRAEDVFAAADTDEWDDTNSPSSEGTFDSTLVSKPIDVPDAQGMYLAFDSEYRQYDDLTAQVLVSFDGRDDQTVLQYDNQSGSDNDGSSVRNARPTIELPVPDDAESMVLKWRLSEGGNDWYWAIDNVEVIAREQSG